MRKSITSLLLLITLTAVMFLNTACSKDKKHITEPIIVTDMRAPIFTPASGTYAAGTEISIACPTDGAEIRYTLDGTEPDSLSELYVTPRVIPNLFINGADNVIIKAKAFKAGLNSSETITASYAVEFNHTIADPVVSENSGTYNHTLFLSISCPTDGVSYRYTTDGSEPTYTSTLAADDYAGIEINQHYTVLKVKAFRATWNSSNTITKTYTLPYYLIGTIYFQGGTGSIAVKDNYAYVTTQTGFKIVDISNPALPVAVNSIDTYQYVCDITIRGDYLYLPCSHLGLKILNISNPVNPVEVGNMPFSYAVRIIFKDNFAYVSDAEDGIHILDITDPVHPVQVGGLGSVFYANGYAVQGNYVYKADFDHGLWIMDISDPQDPVYCCQPLPLGSVKAIVVSGNYLYAACGYDGLLVVDISNPSSPFIAAKHPVNSANSIALRGNTLYLGIRYLGMRIFDISSPTNPTEIGMIYRYSGEAFDIVLHENSAYLENGYSGIDIININSSRYK